MDDIEFVYTVGMDAEAVERRLAAHEVGVLALADDGSAYAIPVGYHYDGRSLYVRLADDGSSAKMDYVESTSDATLCLYGDGSGRDAWSVLARGTLRNLDESERASFDATAMNESFHRLYVFDQDPEAIDSPSTNWNWSRSPAGRRRSEHRRLPSRGERADPSTLVGGPAADRASGRPAIGPRYASSSAS